MDRQTRTASVDRLRCVFLVVAAVACALPPQVAVAQDLTGALVGTVKDEQGLILVGVRVRVGSGFSPGCEAARKTRGGGRPSPAALRTSAGGP